MIRKLVICTVFCGLTTAAMANVIELDNINADHCRQQLASSTDQLPVVFIYMKGCPYADKLRPIYEEVANEYPARTFYAFNFQDMKEGGESYIREAQTCLNRMPIISPSIDVMFVSNDDPKFPEIFGQIKSSLADDKQGIVNAINFDGVKKTMYAMKKPVPH